tara:strand:+ start:2355 stop:2729 length:375 start_codon:yes stop_codon:yes gene_type:complete
MKLTPEEYLKVLHRRNEIKLTPEEVKYVKEERLKEHTEWSTYLHYLVKISHQTNNVVAGADIAKKVLIAGKSLKVGDIDIGQFERMTLSYDVKQYPEIGYIVRQIIEAYKNPVIVSPVTDIPPL